MILLETQLGDYLLHNALRLDFFKTKTSNTFEATFAIDSYSIILHSFESESDANNFLSAVREEILSMLCDFDHENWTTANLNEICSDAMNQVMEGGK